MPTCMLCGGGGFFSERENTACDSCGGTGKSQGKSCGSCGGLGTRDTSKLRPCSSCSGTGLSPRMRMPAVEDSLAGVQAIPVDVAPVKPKSTKSETAPQEREASSSYRWLPWFLSMLISAFAVSQGYKFGYEGYQLGLWGLGGLFGGFVVLSLFRELVRLAFSLAILGGIIFILYSAYHYFIA